MAKKREGITTTGKDFKAFYLGWKWPGDEPYEEDSTIEFNGVSSEDSPYKEFREVPDDAEVYIEGGSVFRDANSESWISLQGLFRRWQKEQTTTTFLVECNKTDVDSVKAAVVAAGGKVIK